MYPKLTKAVAIDTILFTDVAHIKRKREQKYSLHSAKNKDFRHWDSNPGILRERQV
jgi:hypothetical protein